MTKHYFITIICFTTMTFSALAQWMPSRDESFPRTICERGKLEKIRLEIGITPFRQLFEASFSNINGAIKISDARPKEEINTVANRATIAKNAAFVLLMDRQADGVTPLSTSEKNEFANKVKQYLDELNEDGKNYISSTVNDLHQYRSKELIMYLQAYDMLQAAIQEGIVSTRDLTNAKNKLIRFTNNLYNTARVPITGQVVGISYISGQQGTFYRKNNHALMDAGALGLAAIVLNDAKDADEWINAAMWNIESTLWGRMSQRGKVAGYGEGPHYFRYAFQNLLPFFHALNNFLPNTPNLGSFTYDGKTISSVKNPWSDSDYSNLYEWFINIAQPHGHAPSYDATYDYDNFPALAILENPQYSVHYPASDPNTLATDLAISHNYDLKADYICAQTLPQPKALETPSVYSNPVSGNLVFRSSWNDPNAIYMHLNAENGTALNGAFFSPVDKGHEHDDLSSFIVTAGNRVLAMDPPYMDYTNRKLVNEAKHHNLILVDGEGPEESKIVQTFETPFMSFGEISSFYKSNYQNIYFAKKHGYIRRKALMVRNSYFLLADIAGFVYQSDFVYNLHGDGVYPNTFDFESGARLTNQFWTGPSTNSSPWKMKTHIQALNAGRYDIINYPNGNISGVLASPHTNVRCATRAASDKTVFLSAMMPYKSSQIQPQITASSRNTQYTAALFKKGDGYLDFVTAQNANAGLFYDDPFGTNTTKGLFTDAHLSCLSFKDDKKTFAQAFIDEGNKLSYEALIKYIDVSFWNKQNNYISWNTTFNYQQILNNRFEGYITWVNNTNISKALARVLIPMTSEKVKDLEAVGQSVKAYSIPLSSPFNHPEWTYLEIEFSGPGYFTIQRKGTNAYPSLACIKDPLFDEQNIISIKEIVNTGTTQYIDHSITINKASSYGVLEIIGNSVVSFCNNSDLINNGDGANNPDQTNSGANILVGNSTTSGELRIKEGASLILKKNSVLYVSEKGKVIIENGGTLVYEEGAKIVLNGSSSIIEIEGDLKIGDNANFTFSGNGYIKFSNSKFPSQNITAGINSSMQFIGSDKNNKTLEISQESFYAPDNLKEFRFENGTIAMNAGARIQPGGLTTIISLSNAKITSIDGSRNNHRGFTISGQPNVTIENCTFENGKYGVYAFLTYGGRALTIKNSIFQNCEIGLYSHDKGIDLSNVSFSNCTEGWSANAMSFPSSTDFCQASNNVRGVFYDAASGANLKMNALGITNNRNTGININGSAKLSMLCSQVSDNITGISVTSNAELDLSESKINNITNNNTSIYLSEAKNLYLNLGSNNLVSIHKPAVSGDMNLDLSQMDLILAYGNAWNNTGTTPVKGIDYQITNNLNGNEITMDDPYGKGGGVCKTGPIYVASKQDQKTDPVANHSSKTTVKTLGNVKYNEAIKLGNSKMKVNNPQGSDNEAIRIFSSTILTPFTSPKPQEFWLRDLAYSNMKFALANSYKEEENYPLGETAPLPPPVEQVLSVQDYLIAEAQTTSNETQEFFLTMDKSQTYRLAGQYSNALKTIDGISNCLNLDSLQQAYKNQWRRFINIEHKVAKGEIAKEEIQKYMDEHDGTGVSSEGISLKSGDSDSTKIDFMVGDTIKLVADEIGNTYNWNFGDCSSSSQKEVTHAFTAPGIYNISLIQNFKCGNITRDIFIKIYPKPIPSFTAKAPSCSNREGYKLSSTTPALNFNGPSCTTTNAFLPLNSNNTRIVYEWKINESKITDSIGSIRSSILPPGDHLIELKAIIQNKEGNGWVNTSAASSYFDTIHVSSYIKADFTTNAGTCIADSVYVLNTVLDSSQTYTFNWSLGDGTTSLLKNPVIKYSNGGNYLIKLEVTDSNGCTDTVSHALSIGECSTLAGTIQNAGDCPNINVAGIAVALIDTTGQLFNDINPAFTDSLGNFQFDFSELNAKGLNTIVGFSIQNNLNVTLADQGLQTIQEWIGAGKHTLSVFSNIKTNDSDTSNFIAFVGDTLSFTSGGSAFYDWNLGDCSVYADSVVKHIYTSPGIYNVSLVKNNICSTLTSITKVSVYPKAVPQFNAETGTCSGAVSVTNTTPDLNLAVPSCSNNYTAFDNTNLRVQYEWNFGTGTTVTEIAKNTQHPVLPAGNHIISLKTTVQEKQGGIWINTNAVATFTDTINVGNSFTASIEHDTVTCYSDSVHFKAVVNGGLAPLTYQWTFGDGQFATEKNPVIKYNGPINTSIQLVVTDAGGCDDTLAQAIAIDDCPSIPVSQKDASASWMDYNNDAHLDLLVSRSGIYHALYKNQSGVLVKTNNGTLSSDSSRLNKWGDYNKDGFIDVFTSRPGKNSLFKNNGDGTFTAITSGALITDNNAVHTAAWGDYDNDGYLDLFIGNSGPKDMLYHNNQDGTFSGTPVIKTTAAVSTGSAWGDYDNDKKLDLFVSIKGADNILYHNTGNGSFTKITSGDMLSNNKHTRDPQWVDFDNDGDLDLYVSNSTSAPYHVLYENNAGVFSIFNDVISQDDQLGSAVWSDFDNDGDQDVLVVTTSGQGNHFFENTPDVNGKPGNFVKMSTGMIITQADVGLGSAVADYNNDGYNDVFASAAYANGSNHVFTNTNGCNSWIKIKCEGTISNKTAIGARVHVKARVAGIASWQYRALSDASASIASFGLFDADIIDSLVVKWPTSNITQTFTQVPVDQMLTIVENNPVVRMSKHNLEGNTHTDDNMASSNEQQFSIYPNPSNQNLTTLRFSLVDIDNVTVEVLDLTGKLIMKPFVNKEVQAGDQNLELNLAGISNGIYYVRFISNNSSVIQKLSVVR